MPPRLLIFCCCVRFDARLRAVHYPGTSRAPLRCLRSFCSSPHSRIAPPPARARRGRRPSSGGTPGARTHHRPSRFVYSTLSGGAVLPRRQDSCGVDWCTSKEILSVATEIKTSGLQAIGYDHINRECGPRSRSPAQTRLLRSPVAPAQSTTAGASATTPRTRSSATPRASRRACPPSSRSCTRWCASLVFSSPHLRCAKARRRSACAGLQVWALH